MVQTKRDGGDVPSRELILGVLSCHSLYLLAIFSTFGLVVGTWAYPKTVGLCLALPYLTFTFAHRAEQADGARWMAFSRQFVLWKLIRRYLRLSIQEPPKELLKADAEPDAQFIVALFPHGTASDYRVVLDGMWDQAFPNSHGRMRTLAASVLFHIPFIRELALWTGCIDARRRVADAALKRTRSLVILPGGEAEQLRTIYGRERVYLSDRKGFVKLALRHGVHLVPAFVFGASDYYKTSNAWFDAREWLRKKTGICVPFAFGIGGSPACPLPVKTTVVLGKPLTFGLKEKGNPTNDEVNAAHKKFCEALKSLFDDNKSALGYGDRELEII